MEEIKWIARPILAGLMIVLFVLDKWHTGSFSPQLFGLAVAAWGWFFGSREVEKKAQ